MTDFTAVTSRPGLLNLLDRSILGRASTTPSLSAIQARADSFVAFTLAQATDWRTAALFVAPGPWAGLPRFASRGSSLFAAEAILENAPAMSRGLFASSRLGLVLSAALMGGSPAIFSGCGCPRIPGVPKSPEPEPPAEVVSKTTPEAVEYDPKKNPFEANPRIQKIASEIHTQGGDAIPLLFERLRVGGKEGVRFRATPGYNLTAAQALDQGGDCSDLGNLTIATLQELNRLGASIRGGAYKVHFKGEDKNLVHIVPYVMRNGAPLLLDLQASEPGKTLQGEFEILVDYPSFDRAAALYHAEWGGYFFEKRDWARSREAYRTSLEVFGEDPRVVRGLKAANLNHFSVLADQAFQAKQWSDCAKHSDEALSSARALGDEAKDQARELEANRDRCLTQLKVEKLNQAVNQGQAAFERRDWPSCVSHYEAALSWLAQLPRNPDIVEIEGSIRQNLSICRKK